EELGDHERVPELVEEGLQLQLRHTPRGNSVPHLRWPTADPLGHTSRQIRRGAAELYTLGPAAEARDVAVLDLFVAAVPHHLEELRRSIVKHAHTAQVVEERGHTFCERLWGDAQRRRPPLHEVQRGLQATVAHLEPTPGLEAQALLDAGCDLSKHLRSEEHTSELQSRENLVCRLLLAKKKLT